MKATIDKKVKRGEYVFNLPLFESRPKPQLMYYPNKEYELENFVLHIDLRDEISNWDVFNNMRSYQIELYVNMLAGMTYFTEHQIHTINELYFSILDNNYISGSCTL